MLEEKVVVMIAGPNGSGKTTFTKVIQDEIPKWDEFYINPDDITKGIIYYLIHNFLELNKKTEKDLHLLEIKLEEFLENIFLNKENKFYKDFNLSNIEEIAIKFYSIPRENFKEKQLELADFFIRHKNSFEEILTLFNKDIKKRINYIINTDKKFLNIITGINLISAEIADIIKLKNLEEKKPVFFETTMSAIKNINFLNMAREKNYKIITIFITTQDPEINLARIRDRVINGGHNINPETVIRRFYSSLTLLPKITKLSDILHIYDNSKEKPEIIFSQEKNPKTISEKYKNFKKILEITTSIMFKEYLQLKKQNNKSFLLKDDSYLEFLRKQKMQKDIQKIVSDKISKISKDI